jgi:hypothetical protein
MVCRFVVAIGFRFDIRLVVDGIFERPTKNWLNLQFCSELLVSGHTWCVLPGLADRVVLAHQTIASSTFT